jgi:hypothetical protein
MTCLPPFTRGSWTVLRQSCSNASPKKGEMPRRLPRLVLHGRPRGPFLLSSNEGTGRSSGPGQQPLRGRLPSPRSVQGEPVVTKNRRRRDSAVPAAVRGRPTRGGCRSLASSAGDAPMFHVYLCHAQPRTIAQDSVSSRRPSRPLPARPQVTATRLPRSRGESVAHSGTRSSASSSSAPWPASPKAAWASVKALHARAPDGALWQKDA